MHPLDWLIVLSLNGAVIAYGFYLSRGTSSSNEWFLAGRALPWWGVGLSMFATNVDNADIVSVTGKTYTEGLHIITVYALGSAVGGILASFLIVPSIYRAGFYTNAEYLEARFGIATRVLSALIQIQYRSSMLGLMLWSVFLLLTGLEILGERESWLLIVVLVICAGIYTAWGGLKSVVWTDALQSIIMMVGGAVIFFSVWAVVGGWSGVQSLFQLDEARQGGHLADLLHIGRYDGGDSQTSPYLIDWAGHRWNLGPYVVVLGWTLIGSGYWTVNHTQTMRLMGSRSLWDMKMAATAGVALSMPLMAASACLGVFARAIPEMNGLTSPDQVYPLLAQRYLGVGLKGLVVAGIVAAAVSTFDSMGSALSAIFTRDIYARLLVRGRDDRHYLAVGRWSTVCVLLLGFLYLPFIVLQRNMLDAFTTLIPVFVTPLLTIYVGGVLTRAHRRSGIIGLAVGSAYGVFALFCREAPRVFPNLETVGAPAWLVDRWAALLWSFIITSATMVLTTLLLGRQPADAPLRTDQSGWLGRSSEALPPLKEHPFTRPPPWWASPALYAAALLVFSSYVVFHLFW